MGLRRPCEVRPPIEFPCDLFFQSECGISQRPSRSSAPSLSIAFLNFTFKSKKRDIDFVLVLPFVSDRAHILPFGSRLVVALSFPHLSYFPF